MWFGKLETEDWEVAKYITKLRELKPLLAEKFKVSEIGVFGSFVRNGQKVHLVSYDAISPYIKPYEGSDIDLLLVFTEEDFEKYKTPFLLDVKKEGIVV